MSSSSSPLPSMSSTDIESKNYHRAARLYGKCANEPVVVDAIQFYGIRSTKSDALIKEIAHLYSARCLSDLIEDCGIAARHMQEVGLLRSVTPLIDLADREGGKYVVNFVVKEPKNFNLGVKAGVTMHGDADYALNAGKQNVNGRGETFNSTYAYTVKGDQSFALSFSKPFLGWQKYSNVSLALYRSLASFPWNLSDVKENGLTLQFNGELWQRKLLHTFKVNTSWRKFCPTKECLFSVREHAGHTLKCSVENSIAYDTRDQPLLSSNGVLLKFAQELAGFIGDAAFSKGQIDVQVAAPLLFGSFMSASCQVSLLNSLTNRPLHLLDRLYLGGSHNIRGFSCNSIGKVENKSCLGGATSLAAVLHIYRPLFPPEMLYAQAFVASGAVASVNSPHRFHDLLTQQRISAGLGLTFVLRNAFRLELNYVVPLRYMTSDLCSPGFQFGAGVNFL